MDPLTIAAIGLMIGGFFGVVDADTESEKARKEAKDYQQYLTDTYKYEKEEAELDWKQTVEDATKQSERLNEQADLSDVRTDIGERNVSNDFNQAINQLYLQQEQNTYSYNMQAMQNASNIGQSLASIAGNGIRAGSTLSDAVQMEAANNSALLQFTKESNRSYENYNLANVLNNLAGNKAGFRLDRIMADQDRTTASDLLASIAEGGTRWNIYKNKLNALESSYKYQKNKAQTVIDENSGWNRFVKDIAGFFSGGAKGAKTGYKMGKFGMENEL